MSKKTRIIARAGVIASLYIVLSLIVLPVASGAIQFRIAEGLTLLALIFPEAVVGVTVGCALANLISGCAVFDIVFGSLITLIAGVFTCIIGRYVKNTPLKIIIGGLFPVLLNAFLLPLIWFYCYGKLEYMYIIQVLLVLAGQAVSVYVAGTPLYLGINNVKDKTKFLQ